jgi:hypothetical protein
MFITSDVPNHDLSVGAVVIVLLGFLMLSMHFQDVDSTIVLESVPYGKSGAWAINIWIKPGSVYGNNFQYIFSHAANKMYQTGWESNQARASPSCSSPMPTAFAAIFSVQ